jgi:N-acetylmuramoyl-L-alanine amidase
MAAAASAPAQDAAVRKPVAPALKEYPILTERRQELTREYVRLHYGLDTILLGEPQMIVVHYTAIAGLSASLGAFKPDLLGAGRTDIAGHGDVNVGIHYVVSRDGAVYRLLPEVIIARHTIGFNWCALGIELAAKNAAELTDAQLEATANLVAWIASRYPSIKYLIGHYEYMKKDLPHFTLYRELDRSYTPTVKTDPGEAFMVKLRRKLADTYGLELLK